MSYASSFDAVELIRAKRDGEQLSGPGIDWLINAYTSGAVSDEQMSAMAMAVFFRGLTRDELAAWTKAMIASGERMNFAGLARPTVDKHSTGGVGDKITLALTPLVAACGAAVPQLSGRGLGHTGGTLDKLEAIPGWRASLSNTEMFDQLSQIGAVICAAGAGLAPADAKLYALRDVTATVESIPMIAASIMSKKIAEGTASLVLDVKTGAGAFMKTLADSRLLATTMVDIGNDAGVNTVALITEMNTPLGRSAGNAVEVAEALEVLAGGGPPDVVTLTLALATQMLALAGIDADPSAVLASGQAMDTWQAMIRAQGGDPSAPLPKPKYTEVITAPADGYLTGLDAMSVGVAAWRLGAGRAKQGDPVQGAAGVTWLAGLGAPMRKGQPLFELHTDTPERIERAKQALANAAQIGSQPLASTPVVRERIG